ncbi:MAG: DUF4065 domain-containing protein [Rhizobacter sp.]|nr:DUF4065 domain-containing protein [Rhizobacter sp.]
MKLQKLVFFMHAWSLALSGETVVKETPEAWQYGPVFDSLYHSLKGYGSRNIDTYLQEMNPTTGQREPLIPNQQDTHFWNLLAQVWARYGGLSALQLSALTHEDGSPWATAKEERRGWLDDKQVADFYRQKLTAHAG